MARIRSIKPEFWTDPDIVALPIATRLAFVGMWNHADDYGVLKDDPARLKLQILPADDIDFAGVVDELVESGHLLRRVASDGTKLLVIRTFCVHQKIDRRAVGRWGHPSDFGPTNPAQAPPIPPTPSETPPAPTAPTPVLEGTGLERSNSSSAPPPQSGRPDAPEPDPFVEFWSRWPKSRRIDRAKAQTAFKSASKRATAAKILAGLDRWCAHWRAERTDPQFIPHPQRWLANDRWLAAVPSSTAPLPDLDEPDRPARPAFCGLCENGLVWVSSTETDRCVCQGGTAQPSAPDNVHPISRGAK